MSLLALATTSRAEEVHYVIKATPALVYIDVGVESGAAVGGVGLLPQALRQRLTVATNIREYRVLRLLFIGAQPASFLLSYGVGAFILTLARRKQHIHAVEVKWLTEFI